MKKSVTPFNEETLISLYKFNDLVDGWHFRLIEISNGAYRVEGIDKWGHSVSRTCSDPELTTTLEACAHDAREIIKQLQEQTK